MSVRLTTEDVITYASTLLVDMTANVKKDMSSIRMGRLAMVICFDGP